MKDQEKEFKMQQLNEDVDEESTLPKKNMPELKKMRVVDYLLTSLHKQLPTFEKNIHRIGNTIFTISGRLLIPQGKYLTGKVTTNGWKYIWNTEAPHPIKKPVRKFVPYLPGTIGAARNIETELAAFNIYITENMLSTILIHTNEELKVSQYNILPTNNYTYPLSLAELNAFIGILYLSAAKKYSKSKDVTNPFLCGTSDFYNTIISNERFEHLMQCLRFDKNTRNHTRDTTDPLSGIRNIWEKFITKCSEVFRPSANCIVDELFVDYIGNCEFLLPIPKEPQKSILKSILLCDSGHCYIMSGVFHVDENQNHSVIAENVIEKLTTPIHGTNSNITYGSDFFTSVSLAKKMFRQYKLTTVTTLRKDQPEIPEDVILTENRIVGSSIFLYNIKDELQLCTYCPKIGEVRILLSNIHFESAIKEPHGYPNLLEFYNLTIDCVNSIKMIYHRYSCSRPTSKRILAIFYTILDLASINSLAILNSNRARCGKPAVRRGDFLFKLALDLILPYINERMMQPNITDSVKNTLRNVKSNANQQFKDINLPIKLNKTIKPIGSERNDARNPIMSSTLQQQQDSLNRLNMSKQPNNSKFDKKLNQNYSINSFSVNQSMKQNVPVIPLSFMISQVNASHQPIYQNISAQSVYPYLNIRWNSSSSILQLIQALHSARLYCNPLPYNNTLANASATSLILTMQQLQVLQPYIWNPRLFQ